jgi:hypothetical protein
MNFRVGNQRVSEGGNLVSGRIGRRFKSCHPDHINQGPNRAHGAHYLPETWVTHPQKDSFIHPSPSHGRLSHILISSNLRLMSAKSFEPPIKRHEHMVKRSRRGSKPTILDLRHTKMLFAQNNRGLKNESVRRTSQMMVAPPSMTTVWPVMCPPASDTNSSAGPIKSVLPPNLPRGVWWIISPPCSCTVAAVIFDGK